MSVLSFSEDLLPIIKDLGAQLWDGPEDTVLIRFIAEDTALLSVAAAKGVDVDKEFEILKEAIRQRAAQKAIRANGMTEDTFFKILSIIVRVAKTLI